MNKKGFAISIILYSMVFLLITIFFVILGIHKTRYNVSKDLRESIMDKFNGSNVLYDIISKLGEESSIDYVKKYNTANGAPSDAFSGSNDRNVYYYTSSTSANLAGQNGNVIFGDYCWQIVRTTADGGVKLIYNGLKTNDDKCPNNSSQRPSLVGVVAANGNKETNVSGTKLYGTSFEIFDDNGTNKFRLNNTFSANWNGDYDNDGNIDYPKIIGNYVCGSSSSPTGNSDTCTVLYYVGIYRDSTRASTVRYTIGTPSHFSQIGTSPINAQHDSLAMAGYMFNDAYISYDESMSSLIFDKDIINDTYFSSTVAYYFGEEAVWNTSTNKYELKTNNATPSATSVWSDIRSSAAGMYTCKSSTDTSCATVYYIVAATENHVYNIPLTNNENKNKTVTWTYGTGYQESNGTYSLTGTNTLTISLKDWYTNYNNASYKNIYICSDFTSTTCLDEMYYIGATTNYQIRYNKSSIGYIFGNNLSYENGSYTINNDDNYKYIWDWFKKYNNLKNSHYTCFSRDSNNCGSSIYYVHHTTNSLARYIILTNNERITDAMRKMINNGNLNNSTLNKYDSAIKGIIDNWYESNMSSLGEYLDEDAVFCNDRAIKIIGGWNPAENPSGFEFKSTDTGSLSCTNTTDKFSKNNNIAKLKYPVGLLNATEQSMMNNNYAFTGQKYWTLTPMSYINNYNNARAVNDTGALFRERTLYSFGVRPVIVLKPGTMISRGNGTYNEPYVINTSQENE